MVNEINKLILSYELRVVKVKKAPFNLENKALLKAYSKMLTDLKELRELKNNFCALPNNCVFMDLAGACIGGACKHYKL